MEGDTAPVIDSDAESADEGVFELKGPKPADCVGGARTSDGPIHLAEPTPIEPMGKAALALGAFWTAIAEPKRKAKP